MSRSRLVAVILGLVATAQMSIVVLVPVPPGPPFASAADSIPKTAGWELVVSRCVICHSLEIATQQRQGPRGWAEIVDRMISYGAPIPLEDRDVILRYLVQHFGDPAGH